MPHATECSTNLINTAPTLSSPPIPIPGPTNAYGRNTSPSSYSTSTVAARTTINDSFIYNSLSFQDADSMNIGFDQSYSAVFSSDETMYSPAITSDPVNRNLQPSYPRDYNCCGIDHQNLVDLLQHVDNSHPGLIVHDLNDLANGVTPFETNTVYSQGRWDSMSTIPISVPSIPPSLTPNSSSHEQKINQNNFNTVTSASTYSANVPSHKQKGSMNNNGFGQLNGYNQNEFDQINGLEQINGIMTQDSLSCDSGNEWMLLSLLYDNNSTTPLRDPNFSSTLFGDQTLSSNPSSISTSLDDDNLLAVFDIPSKALQHQDPLLINTSPLMSISSYPPTPIDYVESSACLQSAASSPVSSDDNSVVVSPVATDQTTTISNLGQASNTGANLQDNTQRKRSSSLQNTSSSGQGSIASSDNDANAQQRRSSSSNLNAPMISNQQTTYGSINSINNSRQRPISPSNNDAHSHVTTQQRHLSTYEPMNNIKIEQGPIGSSSSDTNKTLSTAQRRSSSSKLISNQSATSNNCHSYESLYSNIDGNISQPRRSSTSNIIPSQSSQNEQYGSINMAPLGQGNIPSSNNNVRPVAQLRRSSTSNLTATRSIAATTTQTYGIPIDKKLYIPPAATQYSVNTVDSYLHASSGAKYHPIQPKAGVAMSDVYTDPALDVPGIKNSKKRTVLTSSVDAKSAKRRVSKPSDESIAEASIAVLPGDLSSEVESKSEADIYPYKCAVLGCPKAYKNANGLKYHNEHGHASQSGNGAREKPWACHIGGCLKTYGSKGGLVYHVKHCHPNDLWALP